RPRPGSNGKSRWCATARSRPRQSRWMPPMLLHRSSRNSVAGLKLQTLQALLRQAGRVGPRILGDDLLQRGLGRIGLLQLDLAVADLEHRIGQLVALRILADQL